MSCVLLIRLITQSQTRLNILVHYQTRFNIHFQIRLTKFTRTRTPATATQSHVPITHMFWLVNKMFSCIEKIESKHGNYYSWQLLLLHVRHDMYWRHCCSMLQLLHLTFLLQKSKVTSYGPWQTTSNWCFVEVLMKHDPPNKNKKPHD